MMSAKDSRELWRNRSRPDINARMDALESDGLLKFDDTPEVIIGGQWPAKIPGARRASCQDCGSFVALSPNSGAPMAANFPDIPVICFDCMEKRCRED